MSDPGLPPKPRSLNLLESLVKEEEEKEKNRDNSNVTILTADIAGRDSSSPDFYDSEKQKIVPKEASAITFTEYKMKDSTNSSAKLSRGNPNAGFKGKKMKKPRSRSSSAERGKNLSKKPVRPFSADYNQQQRNRIKYNKAKKGRPKTSTGSKGRKRSESPQRERSRSRSPQSYSSNTYSSDEEYLKKKKYRQDSESSDVGKKKTVEHDDFFDSDKDNNENQRERKSSESSSGPDSDTNDEDNKNRPGTSKEYASDEDNKNKPGTSKQLNGHASRSKKKRNSKTVYVAKDGHHRTKSNSESSDGQRMVVVEDYSSSFSSSSDEESKPSETRTKNKEVTKAKPATKSKPLLSRKKRETYKVFQIDPDLYIEGKLQQKYCELEELMACSFVDQKSHMTRHHLYQMEVLRDQYHDVGKGVGRGRPSSAIIIPRSLPGEFRNHPQHRPSSGKLPQGRYGNNDQDSCDNAYGTIRSVMAAERARKTDRIRTDIQADGPSSVKRSTKKKKKIEAKLKNKHSDSEEENSERPSMSSKTSNTNSTVHTPRSGGPTIDHHIKYTENEKLKKWLKEKDKIYRQHLKEEKKKKREEREKVINEANDRIEKRIKSQKYVRKWMKEKNHELYEKHQEERKREKRERQERERREKEISLPGDAIQIRPQSALSARSDTDIHVDEDKCKGDKTPAYVKQQIHEKMEIEEENKQTKIAHEGPHPPQTKFIYKRPVAGKIKLKMQARGKSPVAQKSNSEKNNGNKDSENEKQMRMSYDEWVKKKTTDDELKRKEKEAQKRKELAKSDPELDRIIPDIAKKRIEDKLNSRKRINTGIKRYDDKANKSFGGADFSGEESGNEKPRNVYRLEGDNKGSDQPSLMVKQVKRPSTAPAGRVKVPHPQKSANSPRKAVIPQKADKIMSNKDESNPYHLPFPPEKGVPAHVAARQRNIFADRISQNLDEIEQRALLNAELIKEGVANIEDGERIENGDKDKLDSYQTKMEADTKKESETAEMAKHPNISELMYSPRKKDGSSDSSEEEVVKDEKNDEITNDNKEKKATSGKVDKQEDKIDENKSVDDNAKGNNVIKPQVEKNHYKTYENLNELSLESPRADSDGSNDLGVDIENLKERVAALTTNAVVTNKQNIPKEDTTKTESIKADHVEGIEENDENKNISVEMQGDQHLVSILKESKRMDNIPVPEKSDEPNESVHKPPDSHENQSDEDESPSPREDLTNSKKRVSFNEQPQVFRSFDSSSTGTVTPDPADFDTNAESLDRQGTADHDDYEDTQGDWDNYPDDFPPQSQTLMTEPPLIASDGEKVSINIGGFELNPTIITTEDEKVEMSEDNENDDQSDETNSENQSTFITNPDDESNV